VSLWRHAAYWGLALLIAAGTAKASSAPLAGEAGRAIYQDGQLANSQPLQGTRESGVGTSGAPAACVNCHQRSGLGTREGQIQIPPVTGDYLFQSNSHGAPDPMVSDMAGRREAYTDATLARAIREGVDSRGHTLSALMPRYAIDDSDMASLIGYLRSLSARPSAGVAESVLHLATIVTPDADPIKKQAVIDVLQHYVTEVNSFPLKPTSTMRGSGHDESGNGMYMASKHWQLQVWELSGPSSGWRAQLQQHLAAEPVFAILSGVGGSNWAPVHEFCEDNEIPCLFPNLEVPVTGGRDFYSLYFSRGVLLEADLMAWHMFMLSDQSALRSVAQIYRSGDSGSAAAAQLKDSLQAHGIKVRNEELSPAAGSHALQSALRAAASADALVLWLRPVDLQALGVPPAIAHVYVSGLMGGLEDAPLSPEWRQRALLAFPVDLPSQRGVRLDYPMGWFMLRHIPVTAMQVQVDTYLACSLLTNVLQHDASDSFVRPYLIEQLQRMLEHQLITGYYPHLTLATHQRFASKGGYLAHFAAGTGKRLIADSDWIVP
jgi:cytochrome c553